MALGLLTEQVIRRDHPDPAHMSSQEAPDPAFLPLLQVSRCSGFLGQWPPRELIPVSITITSQDLPPAVKPLLYGVTPTGKQAGFVSPILKKKKNKQKKTFYQCNFFPHDFSALFHEEISQEFSPLSLTPFPLEPAVIRLHSTTSTNPSGQCQ